MHKIQLNISEFVSYPFTRAAARPLQSNQIPDGPSEFAHFLRKQQHRVLCGLVLIPTGRGDMVVATFELHLPAWWHALDNLYKSPAIYVTVDGNVNIYATGHPNRFVTATASEVPLLVGYANLQYFPAFRPVPIHTFALTSSNASKWTYTVTFYTVPMS